MLSRLDSAIAKASLLGAWLGMAAIAAAAFLTLAAIVMRNALAEQFVWIHEVGGYLMATSTYCALAYALRQKAHIRATLLTDRLGTRLRPAFESISAVLALSTVVVAMWFMASAINRHFVRGTVSETGSGVPLFIPMSMALLGLILLGLELLLIALRPNSNLNRAADIQLEVDR